MENACQNFNVCSLKEGRKECLHAHQTTVFHYPPAAVPVNMFLYPLTALSVLPSGGFLSERDENDEEGMDGSDGE